jgi:anti-anti-sigma factor
MQIKVKTDTAQIDLEGRFVFETHREFRSLAERLLDHPGNEIRVDLSGVDYMDSSALGMLLVLNDKARKLGKSMVVSCGHEEIRKLFEVAHMDEKFTVLN